LVLGNEFLEELLHFGVLLISGQESALSVGSVVVARHTDESDGSYGSHYSKGYNGVSLHFIY